MSITFRCSCGREFTVEDQLAGRRARCKQCGQVQRIPGPQVRDPEADVYGFSELPPPRPGPAAANLAVPSIDSGPGADRKRRQESNSRAARAFRGFVESMPRTEELHYPAIGAAAVVLAIVLGVLGGFLAQAFFVGLTLAAIGCFLWACGSGLSAASNQSVISVLTLIAALIATAVVYYSLIVPNPTVKAVVAALTLAAFCYGAFFFEEKRGEPYRQPIAIGMLASLLVVAFTIMLTVARYNLARGITGHLETSDAGTDGTIFPPVAGRPIRGRTNQTSQNPVDLALSQRRSLPEARRGFPPKAFPRLASNEPLAEPPQNLFRIVHYESAVGPLAAYLTPDPGDGQKHPAIIWITGGDCNSIGDVWSHADPANDQSATAYRQAGLVMMFPSLRGGNQNPGQKEAFLGEVDDVLAAADFLVRQDYVDPGRIYLGGHSTGGTLVMLVAESTRRFRAVFSFGPVNDVRGYPPEFIPFDTSDPRAVVVRSPGYWLHSIQSPTFVFEGETGNIDALRSMKRDATNPQVHFYAVAGANHFTILNPINHIIASKIVDDHRSLDKSAVRRAGIEPSLWPLEQRGGGKHVWTKVRERRACPRMAFLTAAPDLNLAQFPTPFSLRQHESTRNLATAARCLTAPATPVRFGPPWTSVSACS